MVKALITGVIQLKIPKSIRCPSKNFLHKQTKTNLVSCISSETTETTGQEGGVAKDWAQQVDEAEKQMTLDEYKKQIEAKKRAQTEKLPQFKTRTAGEGEDPKAWEKPAEVYRKKTNADDSEEEEEEEVSGVEDNESEEELEEEQSGGKKKLIVIPLHFKPIDVPRGSARGGPRRGGNPRYRDRPPRDEQGAREHGDLLGESTPLFLSLSF